MLKVVALIAAAGAVGVLIGRPQLTSSVDATVLPLSTVAESAVETIVVHVSGEVVSPGLVEVAAGARVADVVAAAGGGTMRANLPGLNLAETVVDGQRVVVPSNTEIATVTVVDGDTRIRINDADAAALESLPGVGPVLAASIAAHREEYGPFRSVDDLLDVPGIGEQKLASLRDRVIVP